MHSASGRLVVTFNGEIYNHAEIRRELETTGHAPENGWRGHSDTETLLEAIASWGLEPALGKSVGMFAFALWDRTARSLRLVRDRFGEKPLYYGWVGKDFVFASELKAIRAHPRFDRRDRPPRAAPVRRAHLHPGAAVDLSRDLQARAGLRPDRHAGGRIGSAGRSAARGQARRASRYPRYWSYRDVVRDGLEHPIADETEALDQLEQVLAKAISDQSVADVPVGAFLSGGIDSSTIVALYQKYSSQPVRTFTIGFEEAGFNEAEYAKAVAKHFGTVHSERYVTVKETRDVIPLLPSMYDEPFADPSQIPTYLVSRFAREQVTVALTGDGGDELFGGYNRYFAAPRLWSQLNAARPAARGDCVDRWSACRRRFWDRAALPPATPLAASSAKDPASAAGRRRAGRNSTSSWRAFLDEWASRLAGARRRRRRPHGTWIVGASAPDTLRMMYCDAVSYLPDDILCKVDRASMAVSLETRVPFLDHRVAELAARIPLAMKLRGGTGKHILRKLLYREAPKELFERPKSGFGIPVGEWIKGPLRPWAEDLLDPAAIRSQGWFNPDAVALRWRQHLSGNRDSTPALWAILMFQAWLREQNNVAAAAA